MTALQTAIAYWHRKHGIQADEQLSTGRFADSRGTVTLRNCNGLLGRVKVYLVRAKAGEWYFRCREV